MNKIPRRNFIQKIAVATGGTMMAASLPAFLLPVPGKKLNIALCGLGNYARILAEGLAVSNYCRLAGIVTGTPSKAAAWKQQYQLADKNIYNYQNFDEIANNKDIDLVYVVLPNAMHKEFVIRTARAGKHVITEKPMATSVADCEAMIAACQQAAVQLAVGYRLHYEPYNLEMKRLGQEKVFGQVRLIESSLGYRVDSGKEWRLHKALSGGGPLMNLGVYCIQAARYILGEEPIAITAQFNPAIDKSIFSEVEASISWQMEFPSGAVSNSISSYTANVDRLFASADNGQFELSPAISYGPFKGNTSNGVLHFPDINQQAAQFDGIGKLLLENKTLPSHITGAEGLKDVKIMMAIYTAAQTGQKVQLI